MAPTNHQAMDCENLQFFDFVELVVGEIYVTLIGIIHVVME